MGRRPIKKAKRAWGGAPCNAGGRDTGHGRVSNSQKMSREEEENRGRKEIILAFALTLKGQCDIINLYDYVRMG